MMEPCLPEGSQAPGRILDPALPELTLTWTNGVCETFFGVAGFSTAPAT
jgi:hypothetical protein